MHWAANSKQALQCCPGKKHLKALCHRRYFYPVVSGSQFLLPTLNWGIFLKRPAKLFLSLSTAVLIVDQISKAVVSSTLGMHQVHPLIHGLLNLTRVHNTGAAFGLLAGQASALRTLFFLTVSALAIGVVCWMAWHLSPDQKAERAALSLILGGALGNMVDRVRLGEVIDFIDVYYRGYHWPAFNVADSAITAGVILLLWRLLFSEP
jgi:signal peptidase II